MARWQKICLLLLHNRHGRAITPFYKKMCDSLARSFCREYEEGQHGHYNKIRQKLPTSKDMGSLNQKGNQSTPDWDAR